MFSRSYRIGPRASILNSAQLDRPYATARRTSGQKQRLVSIRPVKAAARDMGWGQIERPRSRGELGSVGLPIPRQELMEPLDVVIVDARVDIVEPRGLDQGVHHGGTLAAAVGAGEQP
jgi:hypothetical protein